MEQVAKTAGIAPAKTGNLNVLGALNVLQFTTPADADTMPGAVMKAANEVSVYHPPVGDQAARHGNLSQALETFLVCVVANCPPGPERSTAISRAREAKMWASAAVALEGK
jgi:hypothetical protein